MNDKMVLKEIQQTENQIKADMLMTEMRKKKFISELKTGLGDEIKKNPNTVKIIKKPWFTKVSDFFKKIFKVL